MRVPRKTKALATTIRARVEADVNARGADKTQGLFVFMCIGRKTKDQIESFLRCLAARHSVLIIFNQAHQVCDLRRGPQAEKPHEPGGAGGAPARLAARDA